MDEQDVIIPSGQQATYERFHYAPAVRAGEFVLCSGVLGVGPDGSMPADISEQVRNSFESIRTVLEAAGVGLADIVELQTYHLDMRADMKAFMAIKDEFLRAPYPAWTAVGVSALAFPGARIEIKATARRSAP